MKINVEIKNLTKKAAKAALIKKAVAAVIKDELNAADKAEIEVSVALMGPKRIKNINKKYRQIDNATDVLSFAQENRIPETADYPSVLGELLICPEIIGKDARDSKASVNHQTAWAVIHGTLHLLGYDHEKNKAGAQLMRQKERCYLKQIFGG